MRKRIFAVLFGIGIALLLAEVLLRVFRPFEFRVRGDEIVLRANTSLAFHNRSNPKLNVEITHTKNSLGFRGPEPPQNWQQAITVVTVGGSTTECYYLSDDKTWPAVAHQRLQKQVDGIWINNAGLDGHSTFGHDILLRDYIIKLKPDYAMFLVGCNDIGRDDLNEFDTSQLAPQRLSLVKRLAKSSEVMVLARNLYLNYRAYRAGVRHQSVSFDQLPLVQISESRRAGLLDRHRRDFLPGFRARLARLVERCQANGIAPILITQPLAIGQGIDQTTHVDLAAVAYEDINGAMWWEIMELYNEVTRSMAHERQIPLIDLAATLEKDTKYFYDFVHFSNQGAERVGELVAVALWAILQRGCLDDRVRP